MILERLKEMITDCEIQVKQKTTFTWGLQGIGPAPEGPLRSSGGNISVLEEESASEPGGNISVLEEVSASEPGKNTSVFKPRREHKCPRGTKSL